MLNKKVGEKFRNKEKNAFDHMNIIKVFPSLKLGLQKYKVSMFLYYM